MRWECGAGGGWEGLGMPDFTPERVLQRLILCLAEIKWPLVSNGNNEEFCDMNQIVFSATSTCFTYVFLV